MSNKNHEQFLTDLYEGMEENLEGLVKIAERMLDVNVDSFPANKRKDWRDRLHYIQAILAKPEVEEQVDKEEKEDPSESSVHHPEYGKEDISDLKTDNIPY